MAKANSIPGRGEAAAATAHMVPPDAPWAWLAAGWRDLLRVPRVSLAYGLLFAGISGALTWSLFRLHLQHLLMPMAAGFMLVGPMLAVGLYETSRRLSEHQAVGLRQVLFVTTRSPTQLAFLGAMLMLMLLAWIRIALLIYALFFGLSEFPGFEQSVHLVFFTPEGLGMLAIGGAIGGAIAAGVFAVAAFAVPMLMVRDMDAISAMIASVAAVRANLWPMLVWGWLIVVLTGIGIATLYVGLIVTFPLLGHATWHAYRHVIDGTPPPAG